MRLQILLAVLATTMLAGPAVAETTCSFTGGKSCCNEERHNVLGAPVPGSSVVQAPSIVTADGGASYDVFAQGWDNAVWTRHFAAGTWGAWTSLGGTTTSRPTAVTAGPDHVYVFARASDNAAWYRERTGSAWGPWRSLGGTIIGGLAAAAWSSGEVEVFAHASDHALWRNSLIGSTASGWTSLGGTLYGEPTAAHAMQTSGERIDVWVMASDMRVWRRMHQRVPVTIRFFTTMTDTWSSWKPMLDGTTGAVGLLEGFTDQVWLAIRDYVGNVYIGSASATSVWVGMAESTMTTRSDVSMAPAGPSSSIHYAYVDRDTAVVEEFHYDTVCSTCGDGRCYGPETCSSCAADCGACIKCGDGICNGSDTCSSCPGDCGECPKPPPSSCQDYKFCIKDSTSPIAGGRDVTGYGCTHDEARDNATKGTIGGVTFDGPCPTWCGGATPFVKEWCCKDTGTTYYGAACKEGDADKAAKNQDLSCGSWSAGWCD